MILLSFLTWVDLGRRILILLSLQWVEFVGGRWSQVIHATLGVDRNV